MESSSSVSKRWEEHISANNLRFSECDLGRLRGLLPSALSLEGDNLLKLVTMGDLLALDVEVECDGAKSAMSDVNKPEP